MAKKHPCEGGCWFCHDDSGEMMFSCEFDTFVHEQCLCNELSVKAEGEFEENPEARIMGADPQSSTDEADDL